MLSELGMELYLISLTKTHDKTLLMPDLYNTDRNYKLGT